MSISRERSSINLSISDDEIDQQESWNYFETTMKLLSEATKLQKNPSILPSLRDKLVGLVQKKELYLMQSNFECKLAERLNDKCIEWCQSAAESFYCFEGEKYQPLVNKIKAALFLNMGVDETNCEEIFQFGLKNNYPEIIEKVLEVSPSLAIGSKNLFYAIGEDFWEIATILVQNGADIHGVDSNGASVIFSVIYKAKFTELSDISKILSFFKELIEQGVDIDQVVWRNGTTLMDKIYFDLSLDEFSDYLLFNTRCKLSKAIIDDLRDSVAVNSLWRIFAPRDILIDVEKGNLWDRKFENKSVPDLRMIAMSNSSIHRRKKTV